MTVELGIIEGFYGKPWRWDERAALISFLAAHGYGFYLYAPKTDAYLRRRWQESHPEAFVADLKAFARHCRALGVRFGIGLSPYELYADFSAHNQQLLAEKLRQLQAIGIDALAILFDDMPSSQADLAARPAD